LPLAWTCTAEPETHGAFFQSGLRALAERNPELQPLGAFGCPICIAIGKQGSVRAATASEAARLAVSEGE
jgi:hypothetical protein